MLIKAGFLGKSNSHYLCFYYKIIMLIYLDHGRYELALSEVDHTQVH